AAGPHQGLSRDRPRERVASYLDPYRAAAWSGLHALQATYPPAAAASRVITSRSSDARNLIRMHSCAWYLVIPGTTRTKIVPALAPAAGSAPPSLAGALLARAPLAWVLSDLALSAEVALAGVALRSPLVAAVLPESAGTSLGTVVSAGLRAVGVIGGTAGGAAAGLAAFSAAAGFSVSGPADGAGRVLRISVGWPAARDKSGVRGAPALA